MAITKLQVLRKAKELLWDGVGEDMDDREFICNEIQEAVAKLTEVTYWEARNHFVVEELHAKIDLAIGGMTYKTYMRDVLGYDTDAMTNQEIQSHRHAYLDKLITEEEENETI